MQEKAAKVAQKGGAMKKMGSILGKVIDALGSENMDEAR